MTANVLAGGPVKTEMDGAYEVDGRKDVMSGNISEGSKEGTRGREST